MTCHTGGPTHERPPRNVLTRLTFLFPLMTKFQSNNCQYCDISHLAIDSVFIGQFSDSMIGKKNKQTKQQQQRDLLNMAVAWFAVVFQLFISGYISSSCIFKIPLKLNELSVRMYLNIVDIRLYVCVRVCLHVCVSPPACMCVCVCVFVRVCVHSSCLFSVQQNLINSAGMEIISAASAQETERDGEEAAWRGGVGRMGGLAGAGDKHSGFCIFLYWKSFN